MLNWSSRLEGGHCGEEVRFGKITRILWSFNLEGGKSWLGRGR